MSLNPGSISENGGTATGTVTRNNFDLSSSVTVTLSSSDTTEATVPASVTIPAGASSATFTVQAVDDTVLDGSQFLNITSTASGYVTDTKSLTVTDYETLSLSLSATTVAENSGTLTGTVTRNNTDIQSALSINLFSSDTSEITVPAAVTIPAGQASVDFTITVIDDALLDGLQTATITAQSAGYINATKSIDVTDYETLTLTLLSASISELGGVAQARVTRTNRILPPR